MPIRPAALAVLALAAIHPRPAVGGEYGREPAVTLSPVELRAVRAARSGRPTTPSTSGALVLAARDLAARAARGAPEPIARPAVRAALARAFAADPSVAAVLAAAGPDEAADTAARSIRRYPASHLGVGAAERDGTVFVVLLASDRHPTLSPFPRDVAPGAKATLSGSLPAPLGKARVYVTRPSGEVVEAGGGRGRGFSAPVEFPARGRYVVEVIGEGAGGPEIAGMLIVSAGGAALEEPPRAAPAPEPADRSESEAGVLRALNATRGRHGLPPLAAAADLGVVARRHAEAMAAAGRVAHVLPASPDAAERLRRAGVPYRKVYENVAREGTALEAHAAVEESPGHLANVLRADASRAGIGVARARSPAGREVVFLSEVLIEPPDDGASSRLTPDARVREALWREREQLRLAPLVADPALDDLARDAAAAMRARDETEPDGVGERALALRRKIAAVDVFVGTGPLDAVRSANLRDGRFRRVGVGLVSGDSARFGKGRIWIAVIYTD
ncbi:MAG TPA: CAP domain-containing protein [Anaeromyxobacter sp.]